MTFTSHIFPKVFFEVSLYALGVSREKLPRYRSVPTSANDVAGQPRGFDRPCFSKPLFNQSESRGHVFDLSGLVIALLDKINHARCRMHVFSMPVLPFVLHSEPHTLHSGLRRQYRPLETDVGFSYVRPVARPGRPSWPPPLLYHQFNGMLSFLSSSIHRTALSLALFLSLIHI